MHLERISCSNSTQMLPWDKPLHTALLALPPDSVALVGSAAAPSSTLALLWSEDFLEPFFFFFLELFLFSLFFNARFLADAS